MGKRRPPDPPPDAYFPHEQGGPPPPRRGPTSGHRPAVTGPHRPAQHPPGYTGPFPPVHYQQQTGPQRPPARRAPAFTASHYAEGYDDYDEGRPARLSVVIGVSALVSAITVVILYLGLDAFTGGGKLTVPAVVGQSTAQARLTAQNSGLAFVVAGKTHDPVIKKDHVALQSPLAGTTAASGSVVAVTLSKGPSKLTLPALTGTALTRALERLKTLGLELGETSYQAHGSIGAGMIITTDPGPGTTVMPGARIKLVVSKGGTAKAPVAPAPVAPRPAQAPASGRVSVPKVHGVRLQFARPRLRAKGLAVGRISYSEDEDRMEDMVLSQSPTAGTTVPRGSRVNLVVNRHEE